MGFHVVYVFLYMCKMCVVIYASSCFIWILDDQTRQCLYFSTLIIVFSFTHCEINIFDISFLFHYISLLNFSLFYHKSVCLLCFFFKWYQNLSKHSLQHFRLFVQNVRVTLLFLSRTTAPPSLPLTATRATESKGEKQAKGCHHTGMRWHHICRWWTGLTRSERGCLTVRAANASLPIDVEETGDEAKQARNWDECLQILNSYWI